MSYKFTLRQARDHKGLTQDELAEIIGVSRTTIASWEAGNSLPSIPNLDRLCQATGIAKDDIFLSYESTLSKQEV